MSPSQKKEIEEKFDKKFPWDLAIAKPTAKSFLFSVLDQALAEQREELKKELIKRIEDMVKNPLLTQSGKRAGIKAELDSLQGRKYDGLV